MAKAELFQKDIPKKDRVFYYTSEEDDLIQTEEQENKIEVKLPEDYVFIHKNVFWKLYSAVLYRMFKIFVQWYERSYLEMKIKGREKFKQVPRGQGYVVYANHTNPFHDAFAPAITANRRIRTIISPVNLLIPGIGKLLPALGGMPLGSTKAQKADFNKAVDQRLKEGNALIIYPEAHVWPYYTGIRKFPAGDRSFKYAVRNNLPVFTMVTTYQKSKKRHARPAGTIYVDGPFYPDSKLPEDERQAKLCDEIYENMVKWSKESSYEYFEYRKKRKK